MNPIAEAILASFLKSVEAATRAYGQEVTNEIKGWLSRPYPPAGTKMDANAPAGKSPARRTGELQENVRFEAKSAGKGVFELDIISERPSKPIVPELLEKKFHLPYMTSAEMLMQSEGAVGIGKHLK